MWTIFITPVSLYSFAVSLHTHPSVQFSRSVMSDSLRPHESPHARPPCPSPTPGVHSNSCPSSPWCHPANSSLSSPFPPAPNPSQHQSLFQWVNSSHEVAKHSPLAPGNCWFFMCLYFSLKKYARSRVLGYHQRFWEFLSWPDPGNWLQDACRLSLSLLLKKCFLRLLSLLSSCPLYPP